MVRRAEAAGASAIVVTLDTFMLGRRTRDEDTIVRSLGSMYGRPYLSELALQRGCVRQQGSRLFWR